MKKHFIILCIIGMLCPGSTYAQDKEGSIIYTLQPAQNDVLYKWSAYSTDTLVLSALAAAQKAVNTRSGDDYITSFSKAYKAAAARAPLATTFGQLPFFRGAITAASTDEQVIDVLRHAMDSVMEASMQLIRHRLEIQKVKASVSRSGDNIVVEFYGTSFPEQLRRPLVTGGRLELWETYENAEVFPILMKVNEVISQQPWYKELTKNETDAMALTRPLSAVLYPAIDAGKLSPGPTIGYATAADTAQVNRYLSLPVVRSILPRTLNFLWSAKPYSDGTMYRLYALRADSATLGAAVPAGMITDARADKDYRDAPLFTFILSSEGSGIFARITDAAAHMGTADHPVYGSVAVVADGQVISAPSVRSSITGGRVDIIGLGTMEQIQQMADMIRAGALPVSLFIVDVHMGHRP